MSRKTRKPSRTRATLEALLAAADTDILRELLAALAADDAHVRRECLQFLEQRQPRTTPKRADAASAAILAAWNDLEPKLAELDEYGGGDYETQDSVGTELYELAERLETVRLIPDDRTTLVDQVCAYIRSGNSGMDDGLYEVAYAASRTDAELRDLAERLVAMGGDWPREHARRIYRSIDHERYLELRRQKLEYGLDYHDLATALWERGEREKAMDAARTGLGKAKGRLDELRAFVAERALESGDRSQYLDLQYAQAAADLSPESYVHFHNVCSAEEWSVFEPRILAEVARAEPELRLRIHALRGEYVLAGALIATMTCKAASGGWTGDYGVAETAKALEAHCPEQVLLHYRSGVPTLRRPLDRKEYSAIAALLVKVRRVWVEILRQPDAWRAYARALKAAHARLPAFQEECARLLPDW